MISRLNPWQLSLLIHALVAMSFIVLTKFSVSLPEAYEVPVVVEPVEVKKLTEITEEKPKVILKSVNTPEEGKSSREVFGANRTSYTDRDVNDAEAVSAKKGNTLAKSVDKEVLTSEDAGSLPAPTEDYLVSQMPKVLNEVRPEYPKEARDKKIEGKVVMDILVDQKGVVRSATIVDGEKMFYPGALEAIRKFTFSPAQVDGKPVAVKIRYTLRFQLEY